MSLRSFVNSYFVFCGCFPAASRCLRSEDIKRRTLESFGSAVESVREGERVRRGREEDNIDPLVVPPRLVAAAIIILPTIPPSISVFVPFAKHSTPSRIPRRGISIGGCNSRGKKRKKQYRGDTVGKEKSTIKWGSTRIIQAGITLRDRGWKTKNQRGGWEWRACSNGRNAKNRLALSLGPPLH